MLCFDHRWTDFPCGEHFYNTGPTRKEALAHKGQVPKGSVHKCQGGKMSQIFTICGSSALIWHTDSSHLRASLCAMLVPRAFVDFRLDKILKFAFGRNKKQKNRSRYLDLDFLDLYDLDLDLCQCEFLIYIFLFQFNFQARDSTASLEKSFFFRF